MADVTRMRYPRVILGMVASLLVVAGCGYDDGADLAPVVDRATPAGARILSAWRFRWPDRVAFAQLYVLGPR